jgi:2-succinyl-5-enolpyruvyl-6-hydroxy-3-cyclohexene-1-carboxylate synthase
MGTGAGVADPAALALRAYVGAFVDEMALAGVTDVVICPGSRSTPLAIILREHPDIRVWTHLDERSAAFFALGMARARRRPAAVLCTSGTAAANFTPAVVEAHFGQAPLLVLTADRPEELRGVGALQTIDQVRMYGSHAKWCAEMLLPEETPVAVRHARSTASRAVATAMAAPMGPVHLNFPFREPLIPAPPGLDAAAFENGRPQVSILQARQEPSASDIAFLADRLGPLTRGLIVCGPLDEPAFPEAVMALAEQLRCPVLADALSQVRCGRHIDARVIDCFDAFLRDEQAIERLAPDYVIRFGATPVSKPLTQFLDRNSDALQIVVAGEGTWTDQGRSASQFVFADPSAFCEALLRAVPEAGDDPETQSWLDCWQSFNKAASCVLGDALDNADQMTEPLVFRRLAELLPDDVIVFAGNSMPVRDLDSFFPASPRQIRFLGNRGASGIDGVVSTALGVAAVSGSPLVLVIGDISLYHDMNGLLAAQRHGLNATIIVLNNDGGGIFSFLPQADKGDHFEELFGTPHGLDFRHTAALYGLDYSLTATPSDFDAAVAQSLEAEGVSLIEVRTGRDENLVFHRTLWGSAAAAIRRGE